MTTLDTILTVCFTSIFWLMVLLNELRVHKHHKKELEKMHNNICSSYEQRIEILKQIINAERHLNRGKGGK